MSIQYYPTFNAAARAQDDRFNLLAGVRVKETGLNKWVLLRKAEGWGELVLHRDNQWREC